MISDADVRAALATRAMHAKARFRASLGEAGGHTDGFDELLSIVFDLQARIERIEAQLRPRHDEHLHVSLHAYPRAVDISMDEYMARYNWGVRSDCEAEFDDEDRFDEEFRVSWWEDDGEDYSDWGEDVPEDNNDGPARQG